MTAKQLQEELKKIISNYDKRNAVIKLINIYLKSKCSKCKYKKNLNQRKLL